MFAQGVRQENDVFSMIFRILQNINEVNMSQTSLKLWHERLGHVNNRTIKDMVKIRAVTGVDLSNVKDFFCEAC